MSAWDLMVGLVGQHILPSIPVSLVIFGIVALLFGPGRLRRPADRVVFLYVAILKAALAAWVGSGICSLTYRPGSFGYIGLRLPDVVPDGMLFEAGALEELGSSYVAAVLAAGALLALILLGYRWARLSPVYRGVYEARRAESEQAARLQRVFAGLVDRAFGGSRWMPRPRLLVVSCARSSAFCMGVLSPVVVIAADLVGELGDRELKGIVAHELAHARRMDYLGRWTATILRDLMFWNPFVWAWYGQLVDEQEKASDEWAAQLLGDPVAVASGLVELVAHVRRIPAVSVGPLLAVRLTSGQDRLRQRLELLQQTADLSRPTAPWRPAVLYLALAAFFAAQPQISFSLPSLWTLASGAL